MLQKVRSNQAEVSNNARKIDSLEALHDSTKSLDSFEANEIQIDREEEDDDLRNESEDLQNLRLKIDKLRKKLFGEIKNNQESFSIEIDEGDSNEIEIDNQNDGDTEPDTDETESKTSFDMSNIESIDLTKKFNIAPKKFDNNYLNESNLNKLINNKLADSIVESIDLRAKNLIEKR